MSARRQPRAGSRRRSGPAGSRSTPVRVTMLADALRALSEGVFIAERRWGKRGLRIVFANDSFCALTARSPAELIGLTHGTLHVERADVERLRHWLPTARPGHPLTGEGDLVRADGSTVSAAWSYDTLRCAGGHVTHVVATYRDQTEKRQLQEALVQAQRLDAVGRVAGGVAHDFNNLVSVINGYCEMLAAHVAANPQALREVAEVHSAGRKAAALTQQLLAFSRRQPLELRTVNLNHLIRTSADVLKKLVGGAGELEFDLADDLANVRTDPAQFQQVLLNLVLNARDALRDRGRIVVSTANQVIKAGQSRRPPDPPPGRYVAFTVADNGTGMEAETQKHLFEPFFTTKPEGKGTGLGLALVYGIVQQSGGTIGVKSALLVGSTFEILLPVVTTPVDVEPARVAPLPRTRGHENVLLIEEDEVVRKMVAGILTADGYRTVAVDNVENAGRGLSSHPGSVKLLIASFLGDAEKFARRMHAAHPDLRVLCTCSSGCSLPFAWLAPERQAVLNKPYALSELLKAARKVLDA
ncbi:MAG: PAS domain S-box protein [Verrucomicrobia bacterium]|nr:PAS domain S-box protein [Verrucomicrobiota bacterium]